MNRRTMLQWRTIAIALLVIVLGSGTAAGQAGGTVKGLLTDDSGAVIPAAAVSLDGPGGRHAAVTQSDGTYTFRGLAPGQYTLRATFPGFAPVEKTVTVGTGTIQVPIQLAVTTEKQEVTVSAEAGPNVSVEPDNNATALVLKGEDLQALPDDPDDLSDALQALAGPAAGPNGGTIYIDGFSGGELPPKESIREIRINQNPFSAEYDKLGFGRIEILTKPGSDRYRGALFLNDSDAAFNSRNPFSTNKPDYSARMFGGNFGGPIGKRASFFLDFNRRQISDNALVNAVYLDPATLTETPLRQAVVTPITRTTIAPRLDYQLSANNTLTGRFEYAWVDQGNQGIGGYYLPPPYAQMAYNTTRNFQNLMLTETAVVNTHTINETRFQYVRSNTRMDGNLAPQVDVSGAFFTGGADLGLNDTRTQHYELQNYTSIVHGQHSIKFGVRVRRNSQASLAEKGFGGTFYFDGTLAPVLDANNQPVPGQTAFIQGIEQYRRTLLFGQVGLSPEAIRALGGGPSQFAIQAGNPYGSVAIWDASPFVQDDWRVRKNVTLSLGLRYEIQTGAGDRGDVAPRIGVAWAPGSPRNGRQSTVIRAGFGIFYDRLAQSMFLNAEELNGSYQLNYVVANPNFYPAIPPVSTLTPAQNSIYRLDPNLRAGYMMQSAIGIERQLPRNSTVAVTFTDTRALHLLQTVPINTPLPGTYLPGQPDSGVRPYGNAGNLFEYQSGGLMKQKLMLVSFNTRLTRNISIQGNYTLNYADDLPAIPTDPYNFLADWGRSTLDRRHRFMVMGSVALPLGIRLNPFVILQSGAPYDVLIGQDVFGDTLKNVRPGFAANVPPGVTPLDPAFYNANPGTGGPFIPRDYLTGAGMVSVNLRVGRTFGFGAPRGPNRGPAGGGGGFGGPGGGHEGPGGPGAMRMGPMGGRGGMFGDMGGTSEHRYSVTLSLMVTNILNHVNPGGYVGNLNSPLFALPTLVYTGFGGVGGTATNADNRRIEFQTRFTF
jgi:hypothetical protein